MSEPKVPPGLEIYLTEHRVATFVDWPFVSDCACTPERMAEAGFIHTPGENAPDVVQCFVCFKELEGWEPEDDPMYGRTPGTLTQLCISWTSKDIAKLTIQEFLKLSKERMMNLLKKEVNQKITELEKYAANVRNKIHSHGY